MNLDEAIAAIEGCEDQAALNGLLQKIISGYGFAAYCFVDIGRTHEAIFYYHGTTGADWERDYVSNGFFHVDEVIKLARRRNTPFTWGSVPLPPRRGRRKPGALKVFEASADYRFAEGMVVPLHFVDELGRMHSALCSLIWQDKLRDFRMVTAASRRELHLILVYWMQHSIDMCAHQLRPHVNAGREIALRIHLTDREREVITWAGRGKTVPETADILSISPQTVESYVRTATAKLQVSNKTHAVAKAIHLGLIDL